MKNEKNIWNKIEEMSVGTIATIILFGVLSVSIIYFAVQLLTNEPEFIIYENVCHTETIFLYQTMSGEIGYFIGDYDLIGINNKTYYKKSYENEVCEYIEINETKKCSGSYLCKEKPECCLNYYFQSGELNSNWLDEHADWCFTTEKEWVGDSDNFKKYGCSKYKIGEYLIEVK